MSALHMAGQGEAGPRAVYTHILWRAVEAIDQPAPSRVVTAKALKIATWNNWTGSGQKINTSTTHPISELQELSL